jgi:hypothetical protein
MTLRFTVTWLCTGQVAQTLAQVPALTEIGMAGLVLTLAAVGMFYAWRRRRSAR